MLETYYDIAKKDQFGEFFKDTAIIHNPTSERNSYLILKLDFAPVRGEMSLVEDSFEHYNQGVLDVFLRKYKEYFEEDFFVELKTHKTFSDKLNYLMNYSKLKGIKIYLLLDEYDNFANTILASEGQDMYTKLTRGEGFFRHFFSMLKGATSGSGAALSRMFITGVSPITMDDVTSGFNIGNNISLLENVNELLGLTFEEVYQIIDYYIDKGIIKKEDKEFHYDLMSKWYNNYKFAKRADTKVFNTDMVLYYIDKVIATRYPPEDMIDDNVTTDYKKLRYLMTLDSKLNGNFSCLNEISAKQEIKVEIKKSFPVHKLLDKNNFISLLFYLGLLTRDRVEQGEEYFRIPNYTIKYLHSDYIKEAYEDMDIFNLDINQYRSIMVGMAYRGEWKELFDYLAQQIKDQTKLRDYLNGEKMVHGFMLAYLNITKIFIITSEYEANKGFADIYIEPFFLNYPDAKYSYLLELKYISRKEYSEEKKNEKYQEALSQMDKYIKDKNLDPANMQTELKKLIIIFRDWELMVAEEIV